MIEAKTVDELVREKLEKLLSVVDERMIISFSEQMKAVYIGGEQVTDPKRLQALSSEAQALLQMDIWRILNETPKRLAEKAMFVDDGVLANQLLKGRAILYTLDSQNRILQILKSYTPTK